MAFTYAMLAGYAFEWLAFLVALGVSLSRRRAGAFSSRLEVSLLASMLVLAGASYVVANNPSGPDVGFYERALAGFAKAPLSFYLDYPLYTYPPLQLYLSVLPYLLTSSAFHSLWLVSIAANLASGLLLYALLGRGAKGLAGAALLLFNPYYAQYSILNLTAEALMTPLVLAALLFYRGRGGGSGLVMGAAVLAKQQALYPAFALFVKRLSEDGRRSLRFLLAGALSFGVLSIPFLLSSPLQYLSVISQRPLGAQSLNPSASGGASAFSTFWSVISWLSGATGSNLGGLQEARPLVWVVLMSVVVVIVLRRDLPPSYAAALGYIPYVLASDFAGGWYLIVFIPLLIPVYFDETVSGAERAAALIMLISVLPYRLADNYSLVTGRSPPYVFGDAFLGVASLCFVLLAARGALGRRGGSPP